MEESTDQNKQQKSKSLLPIIFLLIVIVGAVLVLEKTNANNLSPLRDTQQVQVAKYKDGSYDVAGNYISPGGSESIGVKITLKNNIVTDSEVTSEAVIPKSAEFQQKFIDGYKQLVIGKNINEIKLDKVSGASLTTKGFNDAIEKIKAQARG